MKILRSRKALSPVVASIILIAVTVAVSIAVAAWMGALTFNFMATEQLKVTNLQFTPQVTINVTMQNTGTTTVTITEVHVNNGPNLIATANPACEWSHYSERQRDCKHSHSLGPTVLSTKLKLKSSKGNQFTYTGTAPS